MAEREERGGGGSGEWCHRLDGGAGWGSRNGERGSEEREDGSDERESVGVKRGREGG